MTYRELLQKLQKLTEDQLDHEVTVYDTGTEFYYQMDVELVLATDECRVLDVDQPMIRF